MKPETLISIYFIALGVIFSLFHNLIGKGMHRFYQKFYTEKNLKMIGLILGIIFIVIGAVILLIEVI